MNDSEWYWTWTGGKQCICHLTLSPCELGGGKINAMNDLVGTNALLAAMQCGKDFLWCYVKLKISTFCRFFVSLSFYLFLSPFLLNASDRRAAFIRKWMWCCDKCNAFSPFTSYVDTDTKAISHKNNLAKYVCASVCLSCGYLTFSCHSLYSNYFNRLAHGIVFIHITLVIDGIPKTQQIGSLKWDRGKIYESSAKLNQRKHMSNEQWACTELTRILAMKIYIFNAIQLHGILLIVCFVQIHLLFVITPECDFSFSVHTSNAMTLCSFDSLAYFRNVCHCCNAFIDIFQLTRIRAHITDIFRCLAVRQQLLRPRTSIKYIRKNHHWLRIMEIPPICANIFETWAFWTSTLTR